VARAAVVAPAEAARVAHRPQAVRVRQRRILTRRHRRPRRLHVAVVDEAAALRHQPGQAPIA
jgi:hypothetical protein